MISATTFTSGRWIQKCFILVAIVLLATLLVSLHTDSRVMMKQTVGKTITKIKQFTGITTMNISSSFYTPGSTADPLDYMSTDTSDVDVEGSETYLPLDKISRVIKGRFDERTALKTKICNTPPYRSMLNVSKDLQSRMSSLGKNRIKFCRIPKVGTTYLKGLERRVLRGLTYNNGKRPPTKKMIMVREPYSRLVSGYMGKIVTNPPWQRSYGASITRKFRPLATDTAKKCGHDVTFPEFLKYFIEAETKGWRKNIHFVPIYKQCNPCVAKYDYIGHLETIKDDLSYALKSVNVSVDMDFSDEEQTMKGKARSIITQRDKILRCETMCSALSKVWWSFQARGLISTEVPFSMKEEKCKTIVPTEFADMAWNAHLQSAGRINKSKQRRESLVNLYLQATLEDRLKVQELMRKDFELYGYDPQPDDIFPELKKGI